MPNSLGTGTLVTVHLLTCTQVAIGKMFEMFIVHDHADLRLLKVSLQKLCMLKAVLVCWKWIKQGACLTSP